MNWWPWQPPTRIRVLIDSGVERPVMWTYGDLDAARGPAGEAWVPLRSELSRITLPP